MNQFDREVDHLEQMLADGELTDIEFKEEMTLLNQDRQAAAEEAAQDAYNNEMGRW